MWVCIQSLHEPERFVADPIADMRNDGCHLTQPIDRVSKGADAGGPASGVTGQYVERGGEGRRRWQRIVVIPSDLHCGGLVAARSPRHQERRPRNGVAAQILFLGALCLLVASVGIALLGLLVGRRKDPPSPTPSPYPAVPQFL